MFKPSKKTCLKCVVYAYTLKKVHNIKCNTTRILTLSDLRTF